MTQPPASPVPGLSDLVIIARGGYATVYKARQDSISREVALKIDTRTLEDERDRRRFLREAEAAGRMSGHPNIVHVYDAGVTADNHPYLVMELYTEGSYSAKMRKEGPRPPAEVRDLGIKIADALEAAHAAGVLHRDVKPANILINRYGMPGLADFGLAAVLDASRDISVTVEALTPAYAPPEVFRLDKPTQTGDIYSLCATLYALLSGRPPRWPKTGSAPSPLAMVSLHNEPIPDIDGVPTGLVDVLRHGMANDPTQRFQSASELRDALDELNPDGSAADQSSQDAAIAVPASASPTTPSSEWMPEATSTPSNATSTAPPPTTAAVLPVTSAPTPNSAPPYPNAGNPALLTPPGNSSPGRTSNPAPIIALIALVLALIATVITGALLFINDPADKSGAAALSAASGPCPFTPIDADCPTEPQCFNDNDTQLDPVDCNKPHDWEVFVSAQLPETVDEIDDGTRENPLVATLCGKRGLETALGQIAPELQTSVLLPTEADFSDGDRKFHCLAGQKEGQLDKALFVRQ